MPVQTSMDEVLHNGSNKVKNAEILETSNARPAESSTHQSSSKLDDESSETSDGRYSEASNEHDDEDQNNQPNETSDDCASGASDDSDLGRYPRFVSCFVCGTKIKKAKPTRKFYSDGRRGLSRYGSWVSRYRAVYINRKELGQPRISGIGILKDYNNTPIPIDPEASADGDNLDYIDSGSFDVWGIDRHDSEPSDTEALQPSKLWGFLCHDSCWKMLKAVHNQSTEPPIQALFEVLFSLPMTAEESKPWTSGARFFFHMDFGHQYGGAYAGCSGGVDIYAEYYPYGYYPPWPSEWLWANNFQESHYVQLWKHARRHDPFRIFGLEEKICAQLRVSEQIDCPVGLSKISTPDRDVFSKLPHEILQLLFEVLPSSSVLAFKLASPTAATSPLYGSFWASRFNHGSDLEWIYEARNLPPPSSPRDWKKLYFGIHELIEEEPDLLNRARVWGLARHLRKLVSLADTPRCCGLLVRSLADPVAPHISEFEVPSEAGSVSSLEWTAVTQDLVSTFRHIENRGRRSIRARLVNLPTVVVSASVWFVQINKLPYVCGMTFRGEDGYCAALGYVDGKNCYTWTNGSKVPFIGFAFRINRIGMPSIAFLGSGMKRTWFGGGAHDTPQGWLVSKSAQPAVCVWAEFDALKVVKLAIGIRAEHSIHDVDAFWFPDIPPWKLFLSQIRTTEHPLGHKSVYHYRLFGGEDGKLLHHIIRIKLKRSQSGWLTGVEFTYDKEIGGSSTRLWRSGAFTMGDDHHPDNYIDIDGPGGERVTGGWILPSRSDVNVGIGVKLETNRGQTICSTKRDFLSEEPKPGHWARIEGPDNAGIPVGVYAGSSEASQGLAEQTFGLIWLRDQVTSSRYE